MPMFLEYGVKQHNEFIHIEQAGRGLTELICPYWSSDTKDVVGESTEDGF